MKEENEKHICVHRQRRKILAEEGLLLDVDADHDDIVILAVAAQGIAVEGLTDVTVALADGD